MPDDAEVRAQMRRDIAGRGRPNRGPLDRLRLEGLRGRRGRLGQGRRRRPNQEGRQDRARQNRSQSFTIYHNKHSLLVRLISSPSIINEKDIGLPTNYKASYAKHAIYAATT